MKEAINRLISDDKGNIAMTTAERLIKEGFELGINQGKQEGIETERIRTIKKMLMKGLSIEVIMDITELSAAEIEKIRNM